MSEGEEAMEVEVMSHYMASHYCRTKQHGRCMISDCECYCHRPIFREGDL